MTFLIWSNCAFIIPVLVSIYMYRKYQSKNMLMFTIILIISSLFSVYYHMKPCGQKCPDKWNKIRCIDHILAHFTVLQMCIVLLEISRNDCTFLYSFYIGFVLIYFFLALPNVYLHSFLLPLVIYTTVVIFLQMKLLYFLIICSIALSCVLLFFEDNHYEYSHSCWHISTALLISFIILTRDNRVKSDPTN